MSDNNPMPGDDDGLEPPSDELLAGEFVLGVLDAEQRRAVLARIETDPAFAHQVAAWERRFGPLAATVPPAEVPPHVWHQIRMRLGWGLAPARPRALQSVGLWRAIAGLAAAAAIAALIIGRMPSNGPSPPQANLQPAPEPVTTLARDNGTPGWLASIDAARGTLLLVPVPAPADAQGRVPELWLIPPGKAPRPLGLLSTNRSHGIAVPPDLRAALRAGSVLAVSLEPPGGAPHGVPTGPIVAKGLIQL
ncbi:MAG: anti-sigma factor [Steroidobacteraceae bacterium]